MGKNCLLKSNFKTESHPVSSLRCYESSQTICADQETLIASQCSSYIDCIENSFYSPFESKMQVTPSSPSNPTIQYVETDESDDPVVKKAKNLQYIWLIIIPFVIFFGVGKFLYERRHNTYFPRESVKERNVCEATVKFFEEERKYRELANVKVQQDNDKKEISEKTDHVSMKCPEEFFDVDGVCFYEMVDIDVK